MCHNENGVVRYAPLCIHSFRLISPRKLLDSEIFNQLYHSYQEIDNVQDRLRWCRHHMGLMQKEVADFAGVSQSRYKDMETGQVDYFPKEIVDRLADLFGVPATDFLDEYNLFLYRGQGKLMREYRESLGLKKKPFAKLIGVNPDLLRAWESDQTQMTIHSWEKHFKNLIRV